MARINDHYRKLAAGYLFPEIGRRVGAFQQANPKADVIRLGIGDVVLPLPGSVRQAMHDAIDELAVASSFKGYGPERGYDFLREAIAKHDFGDRGVAIHPDEIFVSDGSKCDSGNIQEIFAEDATIAIPDAACSAEVFSTRGACRVRSRSSNARGFTSSRSPCSTS